MFIVDIIFRIIECVVKVGVDMMVVYYGMIWGGLEYVMGVYYRCLKVFIENGLNFYVVYFFFDVYLEVGNNVELFRFFGLELKGFFGEYRGLIIGFWGEFEEF